mmetsp:Transcript_12873/g.31563  ORF Transcript_12873/g.31563 Transcript_12873/m.31563 type:complete len:383 (+) Transcript_12873:65-1213(+)
MRGGFSKNPRNMEMDQFETIAFGMMAGEDLYLNGTLNRVKKGTYMHVKMEKTVALRKAFFHFCRNRHHLNMEEILFKLGDREVLPTESADEVYMEQNDIIRLWNKPRLEPSTLTGDLWKMYTDREYTDVTLVVEGKEFHVHKGILACRCPKFRAMFRAGMQEGDAKEIVLNVDRTGSARAFQYLLEYIYTDDVKAFHEVVEDLDEVPSASSSSGMAEEIGNSNEKDSNVKIVSTEVTPTVESLSPKRDTEDEKTRKRDDSCSLGDVINLFCLAEEYLLSRLKAICEKQLKRMLNEQNVTTVLYHTDLLNSKELKEHCFGIMIENHKEVLYTEEIKHLPQPLLLEFTRRIAENVKVQKRNRNSHTTEVAGKRAKRVHFENLPP